ncbi:MAG: ABC transporter ATP-binding protein [Bacteroidales bacterium]
MSADHIAIKVTALSKVYPLYNSPRDRLKEALHPMRKKYHKDFYALNDVSFEIKKGETIGIIGQNGSGKSTLLKIIANVLSSTSGEVKVNGKISSLLELGTGFNPELNGIENVYFYGTLMGFSKEEMENKIDDILSFADIGDFVYQPVKTYSSGMYVRLAFAAATAIDPEILIVDEALSVGDIRFQLKCFRKFEEFREKNKTIIFVSHSTADIVRLCERTIWLDKGIVRKIGNTKNIVEEYLAWMMHDTGMLQAKNNIVTSNGKGNQQYDLIPIRKNAIITGEGGATVNYVGFFDEDFNRITSLSISKKVKIIFQLSTNVQIDNPYFAFQIINNKGLKITGSNTYILGKKLNRINAGSNILVSFTFVFPEIENGMYLIAIGIADGTAEKHIRHQFIADAYDFQFNSSSLLQKQEVIFKLDKCDVLVKS